MTTNPVLEVVTEIDKIDWKKSEVDNSNLLKTVLDKICCDNIKRIECKTHFLTSELLTTLCDNLNDSSNDKKAKVAYLIAQLGRSADCRNFLTDSKLVNLLINQLKIEDRNVKEHSLRALANIVCENKAAQNLIVNSNGVSIVLNIIENSTVPNKLENDHGIKAGSIGLMLNLIMENEKLQKEVFDRGILKLLIELVKADLSNKAASETLEHIFTILAILIEAVPLEKIFTEEVCNLANEMFKNTCDPDICLGGLDFLEEADVPDVVKYNLAKSGIFHLLVSLLDKKPSTLSEQDKSRYDSTGRVLANILTGDEAMEYLYGINDGEILNQLSKWLSSDDRELAYTAVLCIGNIARTDKHSTDIVEKEINKSLMNILKDQSNDIKIHYAALSTIRNLSIPRINKVRLVQDGLIEVLLPMLNLDLKTSSPVIFKLVGTLRQVIDGQEKLAVELGCNEKLISRLVTWSSATICPWVSSECCRLLCWLVKISKDRNVMLNILRHGGYGQIMKLLGALHGLMQSEAVSALTITSALVLLELETKTEKSPKKETPEEPPKPETPKPENVANKKEVGNYEIQLGEDTVTGESVPEGIDEKFKNLKISDYEKVLLDGGVGEKLKHLIEQHGVKMDEHILENVFTFLEIVTKFEKLKEQFVACGFKHAFHSAMQSRDDYSRFRFRIEGIENSL